MDTPSACINRVLVLFVPLPQLTRLQAESAEPASLSRMPNSRPGDVAKEEGQKAGGIIQQGDIEAKVEALREQVELEVELMACCGQQPSGQKMVYPTRECL